MLTWLVNPRLDALTQSLEQSEQKKSRAGISVFSGKPHFRPAKPAWFRLPDRMWQRNSAFLTCYRELSRHE